MRPPRPIAVVALASFAALVALASGCADSETPMNGGISTVVQFEPAGFPPLAQSEATFELWISFALTRHSAAASAGRFMIDDMGRVVGADYQPMTFSVDPQSDEVPTNANGGVLWQLAADAFVTLEPSDDPDPEPTLPALIAGPFRNGSASLEIGGSDAIDRDFSAIAGSFHLATPTTPATDDEEEGIWFATVGGDSASLVLPPLPTGWMYEAWIALGFAGTQSLGRFSSVDGMDSNGSGAPAGSGEYLFPGHDFPWGVGTDFSSGSVFLTLEPADNLDGHGPLSFLELLVAPVPSAVHAVQPLVRVASFPTAAVTIPYTP